MNKYHLSLEFSEEYYEGYLAFHQKRWIHDCPYVQGEKSEEWLKGWHSANKYPNAK